MVTTEPSQLLATNAIIPKQTSWSLLGRSRHQKSRVRSSRPRRLRLIKTNVEFAPRLARLVTAIARSRQWLDELVAGTVQNVEQIADREKCSIRQVNRTMTLAFLAPSLIQAAVDGRLPRGIGVAKLRDLPAEWTRQYERLGLAPHF